MGKAKEVRTGIRTMVVFVFLVINLLVLKCGVDEH